MPFIQTQGPTTILTAVSKSTGAGGAAGTTAATGDWYQVHPRIGRLAFHDILTTSSVGATGGSTVVIEVSNDGTTVALSALTFALTSTADTVATGSAFASSHAGQWGYIRARLASLTTSTAGSAGTAAVTVIVNGAPVANAP